MSASLLSYLFDLERHGVKLGLDNIRRLLSVAANPHNSYPTLHIAGTNGKGSVAALVEAIALEAGLRVGRFTSPHLIDVSERFVVDRTPIPPDELDEQIRFFRDVANRMNPSPTFFEMNTAIAFRWFQQRKIDLGIIEVGMGGRFDSTNVITPLVCAITNIDLEHTRFLGNTLAQIAFEKAGIIKPGVPVVIGERQEEPLGVILEQVAAKESPSFLLGRDFDASIKGPTFQQTVSYKSPSLAFDAVPFGLNGRYQEPNAAVSVALAERLQTSFPQIGRQEIIRGLRNAHWPCRLERVLDDPPVVLDVAHNPAGATRLARELDRCVTVLGVSSDKDAAGILAALRPITRVFVLSRFAGERSMHVEDLAKAAADCSHQSAPDLEQAIARGLDLLQPGETLLVTGSVFAVGEARRILIEKHGAPALRF